MRTAVLGLFAGLFLAGAWAVWGEPLVADGVAAQGVAAQRVGALGVARSAGVEAARSAGELLALSHDAGEGRRQMTLIDPRNRVMAVYHIDDDSGEISLRSVRAFHWDLLMDDFNGVSPSPREIRSLVEPR